MCVSESKDVFSPEIYINIKGNDSYELFTGHICGIKFLNFYKNLE